MKLIVMLRNPVDRAYSHYNHALKLDGRKTYTGGHNFSTLAHSEYQIIQQCQGHYGLNWTAFKQCHDQRAFRQSEAMKMPVAKDKKSRHLWLFEMLYRGMYAAQLRLWLHYFPPQQFLVVRSEDMYVQPNKVMKRVEAFLGLVNHDWTDITKAVYNFGVKNKVSVGNSGNVYLKGGMDTETREWMEQFFEPYNQELPGMFEDGFPGWQQ